MKSALRRASKWAQAVKRDVLVVHLVARDPRVPWPVKVLAAAVAAYALSPFDLIPDFIPVVGYLDDLVIVPLGILAVVKLVPPEVLAELRVEAARSLVKRPRGRVGAAVICSVARPPRRHRALARIAACFALSSGAARIDGRKHEPCAQGGCRPE